RRQAGGRARAQPADFGVDARAADAVDEARGLGHADRAADVLGAALEAGGQRGEGGVLEGDPVDHVAPDPQRAEPLQRLEPPGEGAMPIGPYILCEENARKSHASAGRSTVSCETA